MTATLHVLSHSPYGDDRLGGCLRLLGDNDAVLLCGDAVYALRPDTPVHAQLLAANLATRLFALEEDITARGLNATLAQPVDYAGFVALSVRFDKVNSWL